MLNKIIEEVEKETPGIKDLGRMTAGLTVSIADIIAAGDLAIENMKVVGELGEITFDYIGQPVHIHIS